MSNLFTKRKNRKNTNEVIVIRLPDSQRISKSKDISQTKNRTKGSNLYLKFSLKFLSFKNVYLTTIGNTSMVSSSNIISKVSLNENRTM